MMRRPARVPPSDAWTKPVDGLSARQREILHQIALGHSNKEIARQLGLTIGTIKQHVHQLFRKLGVSSRTMAAAVGRVQPVEQTHPAADDADSAELPEDLRYGRRQVTAVVVQTLQTPNRSASVAAGAARDLQELTDRATRLAQMLEARMESLPAGGFAAWFGHPVAHGDDAARAVAFARAVAAGTGGPALKIALATEDEVLSEAARAAPASGAFRVAMRMATLAEASAIFACERTAQLAGEAETVPAAGFIEAASVLPPARRWSRERVQEWGGLPFVSSLLSSVQRSRCQWLAVESWPPEAGTRLIDAIGDALAASAVSVCRIWVPAGPRSKTRSRRILAQIASSHATDVEGAVDALATRGPVALIAHGIDSLSALCDALGEAAIERLKSAPLIVVAGAMHRAGAPQTVVRLLGSHPAVAPFVRVMRMQVPERSGAASRAMRTDLQAVLDAVSATARAVARLASDPRYPDVSAVASRLAMSREAVLDACAELERCGLLALRGEIFEFRDQETAAAVRASLA